MRTLSRPMFNMGGPIKQGVMHGIREPYRGGGQAALVGNPLYPRTGGREHHVAPILGIAGINAARWLATIGGRKIAQKAVEQTAKNVVGQPVATGLKGWLARDPLFKAGKWAKDAIMSPTAKGWGKSAVRGLTSPTGLLTAGWFGYPAVKGAFKKEEPVVTGVEKPGGYPQADKKTKQAQAEFAKAQREDRVQKYLKMMGYDRAKKTAIADALIDASKIVSDRGTLDRKNITGELINPIIQATSKRLDKPEQIREAVGLMMTKAGLEKEMYDAKPGTIAKNVQDMVKSGKFTEEEAWAVATKGSQGAVADIQGAIATGKVGAGDWPAFVRSTGAQHGENVEVITDEQIKEKYKDKDKIPTAMEIITAEGITNDGIYVLGSETVRIKDGKVTQLR